MGFKSSSCFGKRTGEPLTAYHTEREAKEGADYANSTYGNNLVPYKCNNCRLWHLSPEDRQTPSSICSSCTDSYGSHKDLYHSEAIAERRAAILLKERGILLRVYPCPYRNGWHLRKAKSNKSRSRTYLKSR